ncbi:MAG: DUF5693 family protein, partial [bacterium]|nr:DUF5693 family protein [bacterium]
ITICGALITAALLSNHSSIMEYTVFRGVKIQYLLPPICLASYLWLRGLTLKKTKAFFAGRYSILEIGMFIALLGALSIYLLRSGHVNTISNLETYLRNTLDHFLIVRPRFKEILGHVIFMVALYYRPKLPPRLFEVGLIFATIGQVSIVNTFMHLRTPIVWSLLRGFHGLWMGMLIAALAILVINLSLWQFRWFATIFAKWQTRTGH